MAAINDDNLPIDDANSDTDLPVDVDAAEANTEAVKGFDKKKVAGLGIVVGLVILAGIAVVSLSKNSADIATDTSPIAQAPPSVPGEPEVLPAKPVAPTEPAATVNPKPVETSIVRPSITNQEWVSGIKKPLPVPNNLDATPGQPETDRPQVTVVSKSVDSSTNANSTLQAAMNRLWKDGAAAKHRGDYTGARKAWGRILELDPGHQGIQEAIDKLPK